MKENLSIIVPFYNEAHSIIKVIDDINQLNINKRVIVINDGSSDLNSKLKKQIKQKADIYLENIENKGKGYSVIKGIKHCKNGYIIIKDADLEYNTDDIKLLFEYAFNKKIEILYGSRFVGKYIYQKNIFFYGNMFFTKLFNLLYKQNITDAHTCYKLFHTSALENISLSSKRFELCAELNSKFSKKNKVIYELPIHYKPRSKKQGKKIGVSDAFFTLITYLKYYL